MVFSETINPSSQNRLFNELETIMRRFKRRNVSYSITAYGGDAAAILLMITGRKGIISKQLLLVYIPESGWVMYHDNKKLHFISFNDITASIQKIITATSPILNKM